jgi:hypothetical protein
MSYILKQAKTFKSRSINSINIPTTYGLADKTKIINVVIFSKNGLKAEVEKSIQIY